MDPARAWDFQRQTTSSGETSQQATRQAFHPIGSQLLQGTSGFLHRLATTTPNRTHQVVNQSAARKALSHRHPSLATGNQQLSPAGPITTVSPRGGCQPTQGTVPSPLGTLQSLQPHSISRKPSRQPQLVHHSARAPPRATRAAATCSLKQTEFFLCLRMTLFARGFVAKESSPPQSTARLPPLRQLDTVHGLVR
jgi:hypothetical protein